MRPSQMGGFARWWRVNLVGGMGIGLQIALLFLLKSVLGLNYLLATGLAVEATVVHNFLWHERYTYADRVQVAQVAAAPAALQSDQWGGFYWGQSGADENDDGIGAHELPGRERCCHRGCARWRTSW
jgi:hypothetical protein